MGCITGARLKDCNTPYTGGLNRIWIADRTEVDAFTTAGTDGAVDSITMALGAVFYEIEFYKDTGQFLEEIDNTNGTIVTQTANFVFRGKTQKDRNFIQEALSCNCGLAVIVEDANGQKWFWGYVVNREAELTTGTADTGTVLSDRSQVALALSTTTSELALLFEATVPV